MINNSTTGQEYEPSIVNSIISMVDISTRPYNSVKKVY